MEERLAFGSGFARGRGPVERAPAPAVAGAPAAAAPARAKAVRDGMEWPFIWLMAFTAVLYLRPQDLFPPLAIIPMAEIAALTGLGTMVYQRLTRGQSMTRMTPELMGVIALGGVMLLTAPFSIWPGGAIGKFTGLYLKVMLIFILLINTLTTPHRVLRFTWVLVLATSYIAFRAVLDYARGMNLIENGRVMGAVGGMFRNPNDLALNMVAILPIAVMLAMRKTSLATRLLAAGGAFLMIGATVVSQSRSGFLGLAVMLAFLTIQIGRKRPMFIAAAAMALVLAMPLVPGSYWSRMSSITDESRDDTGSRAARKILLTEAFEAFLQHPLTGVGAGLFEAYNPKGRTEAWREAHNVILQVASELGIFGTIAFMFLVGRAALAGRQVRRLLRRIAGPPRKHRWSAAPPARPQVMTKTEVESVATHSGAMTASVAGWFFSALFASVAYSWTFYYLLALAVAPREIVADRLKEVESAPGPAPQPALQEARA